jgi:CheY-like chemotaxis protein
VVSGLNGCTILVADDERYITTTISLKLRVHWPDVICTDYRMPLMSGLQFAKRLLASPATAHIPVVMLTTRGHRMSPTEAAQTNIRALLGKPFSTRELLAKLQEVVLEAGIAA